MANYSTKELLEDRHNLRRIANALEEIATAISPEIGDRDADIRVVERA